MWWHRGVSRWLGRDVEAAQEDSWPEVQRGWDCEEYVEDAGGTSNEMSTGEVAGTAPKAEKKKQKRDVAEGGELMPEPEGAEYVNRGQRHQHRTSKNQSKESTSSSEHC